MYGLVNRAIEEMVVTKFGDPAWEQIKTLAGFEDEGFLSQTLYDDAVTYRLVDAASATLGLAPEAVLEAFGEYWVLFTGRAGYGTMFELGGKTLPAFLAGLNSMHTRIAVAMPDARMPAFECRDMTETSLRLHYHSTRQGLAPLVVGILRGLGTMFHSELSIVHERSKAAGDDHDVFALHFAPPR